MLKVDESQRDILGLGLLTEQEFAGQILRRSLRTARRLRRSRQGPSFVQVGKVILYRKDSIVKWLASRERQ